VNVSPPRLASWLLARRLSAEWRDFVLGDLEEEFTVRHAAAPLASWWWYWRQTIRCLARPPRASSHSSSIYSSGPQGDSIVRTLAADFRYAVRVLFRAPSFAVAVIREGMTPTAIGIVIGAVAALASARVMQRLVFGVSPSDPLTLAAVAGTLAIVAVMASLVPAYRASRLDPRDIF
jgi:hypothetical protein